MTVSRSVCVQVLLMMFCILLMQSCSFSEHYAPVTELSPIEAMPKSGKHKVTAGETLYEIAWRYGLDYRYLATRNHILPPYAIHPGDIIFLKGSVPQIKQADSAKPQEKIERIPRVIEREPNYPVSIWMWPSKGKVIMPFSKQHGGITIASHFGAPIYAAAPGVVVYSGNGLRNYGNLIIIKHNQLFLSAYAYNQIVLVKEGMTIHQGQKIAEMGRATSGQAALYFEIRRAGKPIDPMRLLSNR